VIFATHYLEEADAYADRIVLIARGTIVADGPATEIKAKVSGRTIRATLPGVDVTRLAGLPGVTNAERHGEAVILSCSNSDEALRALLDRFPGAHDIEVRGAGIEEAFLALTNGANNANNDTLIHVQGV
jgi:ABC-2 type transport system ATP-binding protein